MKRAREDSTRFCFAKHFELGDTEPRAREDSTRFCFEKPHRAAAAAPVAKNSPPACFLDAPAQGFESIGRRKKGRLRKESSLFWRAREDSNPRHPEPESGALSS